MSAIRSVIVVGGGGHAKVLVDLLLLLRWNVLGYTDLNPGGGDLLGVSCLGSDEIVATRWHPEEVGLVNGVGSVRSPAARAGVFEAFSELGYTFPAVVHPAATVSPHATLAVGAQVMAGAVIQAGSRIGPNVIINTRASIDHDCEIGAHVHVAPGAVLSGAVRVGERAHIGCGATVRQAITIGTAAVVGAGAVVIEDVAPGMTVAGVPAKPLRPSRLLISRKAAGG